MKIRTDLVILPPGGSIARYQRLAESLEPPLTLGSTVQWTAPKFGGSPIYGKKSDALKTKHLFGASFPNPRQDYVVVYEEADMVAALPVSGPPGSPRRRTWSARRSCRSDGRYAQNDLPATCTRAGFRDLRRNGSAGAGGPAIDVRFSRFRGAVQHSPVHRQETQIVHRKPCGSPPSRRNWNTCGTVTVSQEPNILRRKRWMRCQVRRENHRPDLTSRPHLVAQGSPMKTTRYFDEQVLRKRPYIDPAWCIEVIGSPLRWERQPDGRFRFRGEVRRAGEASPRVLRVVTLEDREIIHNAFFDRGFSRRSE